VTDTDSSRHPAESGGASRLWVVKVRIRRPGRVFLFVTPDAGFRVGSHCLVQSDRGLEFGTVVSTPLPCENNHAERVLTKVVRRATVADETKHEQNEQFEHDAFHKCQQMIDQRGMQMKLVRVESTFDRKKVVFYFSAENRVDFRDLVKELAYKFRTRIELRQIGVRDQARLIGGIGVCGRPLCCTTFLREFSPVSIRMAKRQNLALNPSKISGLCGRLMCCILFEDEMYGDAPERDDDQTAEAKPEPEQIQSVQSDTADDTAVPEMSSRERQAEPSSDKRRRPRRRSGRRRPRHAGASRRQRGDGVG